MKKTSFTYGSDVFDKSHFLIKDDFDVLSGTHRHYSFIGYLDGLKRAGVGQWLAFRISSLVFPCLSSVCFEPTRNRHDSHMLLYALKMAVARL